MRGAGETVLVVEDSEDVRVIACDYLEDLGYNVIAVEDADAALRIMAENSIDLLFTDLMMPGSMNGVALAAEVQTRYPDTKILLTTGYNDDLARQGGSNADGLNVVGKPYRRAELADRIYSALHGNHLTERRKQSDFGAAEA
jgi:CheY-like chemotaxis protein